MAFRKNKKPIWFNFKVSPIEYTPSVISVDTTIPLEEDVLVRYSSLFLPASSDGDSVSSWPSSGTLGKPAASAVNAANYRATAGEYGGKTVHFTASASQYYDCGSDPVVPETGSFTHYTYWKCDGATTHTVHAQYIAAAGNGRSYWASHPGSTNREQATLLGDDGVNSTLILEGTSSLDGWHVMAHVRDGLNNWLYVDGVLVDSNADSSIRSILQTGQLIGARSNYPLGYANSPTDFFTGSISEIIVYTGSHGGSRVFNVTDEIKQRHGGTAGSYDYYNNIVRNMPGVVSHWSEVTGDVWIDRHSGYDGLITGSYETVSPIVSGGADATVWDGTEGTSAQVLDTSRYAFIHNSAVFSVSAWIKWPGWNQGVSSTPYTQGRLTIMGNAISSIDKGFFMSVDDNNYGTFEYSNALRFSLYKGTSGVFTDGRADNVISGSGLHHVVVTGDGTDFRFYVNGIYCGSTVVVGTATGVATNILELADAAHSSAESPASGTLSELTISSGTWDQANISALYSGGLDIYG